MALSWLEEARRESTKGVRNQSTAKRSQGLQVRSRVQPWAWHRGAHPDNFDHAQGCSVTVSGAQGSSGWGCPVRRSSCRGLGSLGETGNSPICWLLANLGCQTHRHLLPHHSRPSTPAPSACHILSLYVLWCGQVWSSSHLISSRPLCHVRVTIEATYLVQGS